MKENGPKHRATQLGLGQRGLRPRADEAPPSSRAETQTVQASAPGVLCPSPFVPTARAPSAEHGTVEFSDEATSELRTQARERATSAVPQRAREASGLRDSVLARVGNRGERSTTSDVEAARRPQPGSPPSGAAGAAREGSRGHPSVIHREEGPSEVPQHDRDPPRDRALQVDKVRFRDDSPPRSAPPRSAPPRSAPPRSALPRSAPPRSALPRSAPPRSAPPRSAQLQDPKKRPALRVDDVGADAARMAARTSHDARPKVLVDRRALASAPIDHREAFLVSLVDGAVTVSGLVDVSGMPEGEVHAALRRLVRLGILAV
jgi:hypothetical protein